jgi:hypothetical protein
VKQILETTVPVRAEVDAGMAVLAALGRAGTALGEAHAKTQDPEQKLRLAALLALLRSEWKQAAKPTGFAQKRG